MLNILGVILAWVVVLGFVYLVIGMVLYLIWRDELRELLDMYDDDDVVLFVGMALFWPSALRPVREARKERKEGE